MILRAGAVCEWEEMSGLNFAQVIERLRTELDASMKESPRHFGSDIANISSNSNSSDDISNALEAALFELVKFKSPFAQAHLTTRQTEIVTALEDLKKLRSQIETFTSTSLANVNKFVGPNRRIKLSEKMQQSIVEAQSYLEHLASVEKRGRPPKEESVLIRALFDELETALERNLARSYGTAPHKENGRDVDGFINPDVGLVYRLARCVFHHVTLNDVSSALKNLSKRDP